MPDRVVIETRITIEKWDNWQMFAARLLNLGLTAYEYTEEEARVSVRHLFNEFVNMHREVGDLTEHLARLNVDWGWESDYMRSGRRYEVTSPYPSAPSSRPAPSSRQTMRRAVPRLAEPRVVYGKAAEDEPVKLAA